jgi:hypothetical protein
VISVTDPYGRILGFLDQNRYFFFQVATQFVFTKWTPVPDPLLRKSGSAGNRTRTSGSLARNSDLRTIVRQFPIRSLNFSIYLILPAALWPWVDSASNRNEY